MSFNINERDRDADLLLLADAFYENLERNEHCEFGGWGLDDKRPFGNSSVEYDILEIIGIDDLDQMYEDDDPRELAEEYARELYADLGDFLRDQWEKFRTTP